MKKLISLLAVIALMTVLATVAFASEDPALLIKDVEAAAGEEIVMNIEIVNNPGMTLGEFVFEFDTEALEFVSAVAVGGEGWDWLPMVNDDVTNDKFGSVVFSASKDALTGDCTLVTLTLKVKADAKPGKYPVSAVVDFIGDDEADFIVGTTYTGYVVVPCPGHVWDDGVVTKEPTCVEEGVKLYTCTLCGETKEEAVATVDHAWVETERVEATGCTDGKVVYTCSVCGETKDEVLEATGEHTWAETERVEANCCENGKVVYTCSVCGETKDEVLNATGDHKLVYEAIDDVDHKIICENTGKELGKEEHTFGEMIEDVENPGWQYQLCDKCGYKLLDETGDTGDHSMIAVAAATLSMMGIALVVSKKKEF